MKCKNGMREGKPQMPIGCSRIGGLGALILLSIFLVRAEVGAQTPDKSGVKPSAISFPSGPGSIEGLGESFEPQLNTGSSTYSVVIELPPGRAGLQPSLALSYNSSQGNSIVGIGWNLSIPEIRRQTDKGFPQYNSKDTFTYQGEELVPLSDGTFRCENGGGFHRFRHFDADNDGRLDSWEMTDPNGIRHYFGTFRGEGNRWSVVTHPGLSSVQLNPFDRTFCWALDQSIDLQGNRIEYEYHLEPGTNKLFPSRITYSHSYAIVHEVVLDYEDRPDVFDDYRPTFSERIHSRLSKISINTGGAPVRSYRLAYEYLESEEYSDSIPLRQEDRAAQERSIDLKVSVLKRVTQSDQEFDSGNYLPSLVFFYSFLSDDLGGTQIREIRTASGWSVPPLDLADGSGRTQLADVDGDGLPDLFSTKVTTGAQYVVFNEGLSDDGYLRFSDDFQIAGDSGINLSLSSTSMTDFDADGIVDIVNVSPLGNGQTSVNTFQNLNRLDSRSEKRIGFESWPRKQPEYVNNAPAWFGFGTPGVSQMDVNFDKTSDFVRGSSNGVDGLVLEGVYRSAEGGWRQFRTQTSIPGSYTLDRPVPGDDVAIHLADMNGDRLPDFVAIERIHSGIGATLRVRYWPYCALGQWADSRPPMELSPGDGFQIDNADLRDFFLQDFTGDGLADILRLDGSSENSSLTLRVNVAGKAWSQPLLKTTGLPAYRPIRDGSGSTTFRTADLNGNGSTDLIWLNKGRGEDTFQWLDLMPDAGKPNLLVRIDNSMGKITEIEYGNAHQDYVRAQNAGHPWKTKIPFAVQVVRRIRTSSGYDLNGDGLKDTYVSEFKYRDGFYDGFEKEFRGFAFAERIDYGDDYLWDENLQVIGRSDGWSRGGTSTRQVSGPTLVTRYRFHTGAADLQDNDESPANDPNGGLVDEMTEAGGREEEPLKGRQLLEEEIDPWVLHSGDEDNDFDASCHKAADSENLYAPITDDKYVYTRARQFWGIRRLYRPSEKLPTQADNNRDGVLDNLGEIVQVPGGRFDQINVPDKIGKSVSFSFVKKIETDIIEANELLSDINILPAGVMEYESDKGPLKTRKEFDYDDYGNPTLEHDFGILDEGYDDERIVTTSYALGGEALKRWIINQPDTVLTTDENGTFVNRTRHYYDGEPFAGLPSGMMGDRALLHRVVKFIDENNAIDEQRNRYDVYGNLVEMHDPNFGTEFARNGGHRRLIGYDPVFHTYPVRETISVGDGKPDLVMEADYDYGFGVVTSSTDFNRNLTTYEYDSFGRIVAIVKPGDTTDHPTQLFEYQAFDPNRSLLYTYDRNGNLNPGPGLNASSRVVTHLREVTGTDQVYTTAVYTDGMGKTIAEVGEGEVAGTWIVNKATSYNLRGTASATWLPYQVKSDVVPRFGTIWPAGRPPESDGITPSVVRTDVLYDPVGREIISIHPPEIWGGERKISLTQIYPFRKSSFDENDSDPGSSFKKTPMVHFEDGLGRLVKVHENVRLTNEGETISGENSQVNWETSYSYDLNDKLTRIRDSQGNLKHMQYDGLGRLTFMDDPDRGTMEYKYSPASNLVWTRDAKGQVIEYRYDGVNRILSEDYLDAAGLSPDVTYHYDSGLTNLDLGNGQRGTPSNTRGQLVWVEDLAGEEHFSYDSRGRLEWQLKRIPDTILTDVLVAYQTGYSYDSLDRLGRVFYPDSDQVGYTYNNRNLLQSIDGGLPGSVVSRITYRPSGQMDTIVYGNGVETSYDYDPRLRLRELKTRKADQSYIDFAYTFDSSSNITEITDRRDLTGQPDADKRKNTQKFQYDDLYRLTQVSYPSLLSGNDGHINYRYDRLGNMLLKESNIPHTENGLSITHLGGMNYGGSLGSANRDGGSQTVPGPHALTSVSADGGRAYPYDANGNMTNIDGLACGWDFKDRMISAENDKMHARYVYDYTDRRVIKSVTVKPGQPGENATKSTVYVNKYFELRPGEAPVKYVWNGDTRVARITSVLKTTDSRKTQRLRLHKGWNLQTLIVDGAAQSLVPASNASIDEAVWWNDSSKSWSSLAASPGELPDYPVLWLHANKNTVLPATGSPLPLLDIQLIPNTLQWVPNTIGKSIPVRDLPYNSNFWQWDAESQSWQMHISSQIPDKSINSPAELPEHSAVYISSHPDTVVINQAADSELQARFYHQDHLGSSSVLTDYQGDFVEEIANYPFGYSRYTYSDSSLHFVYGFIQKELDLDTMLLYVEARYLCLHFGKFVSVDPLVRRSMVGEFVEPRTLHSYLYGLASPLVFLDNDGHEGQRFDLHNKESPSIHWHNLNDEGKAQSVAKGLGGHISETPSVHWQDSSPSFSISELHWSEEAWQMSIGMAGPMLSPIGKAGVSLAKGDSSTDVLIDSLVSAAAGYFGNIGNVVTAFTPSSIHRDEDFFKNKNNKYIDPPEPIRRALYEGRLERLEPKLDPALREINPSQQFWVAPSR